jgi:hypothetical protein
MRVPPTVSLKMLIYDGTNGVATRITWKTELQYQAVAIFFKKMLGERTDRTREPGKRNSIVSIPSNKSTRSGTLYGC